MKLVLIPKKKKGEFRQIAIPSNEEKNGYRVHLSELNAKSKKVCDTDVVHGFMNGKSPVTNAKKHLGYSYTLRFDLSDFFDTVKPSHLKGKITDEQIEKLMPDGRAYQGLPTSPIIANIAAIDMDAAILRKTKDKVIVYTRYADDLTFSFNDYQYVNFLKQQIPQIVGRCGFKINKKKTWLQDSRFGDRIVTGVVVGKEEIRPTRAVRRKLRAAIHQKNKLSIRGLTEWTKLKEPNPNNKNSIHQDKMTELCKLWNIKRINVHNIPFKETEKLSDDVVVSGDPVQILGLSNWTTNWRSCMVHPSGQYHKKAAFWVYLKGTRIAGLLNGEDKTEGPFTRPKFAARTLIHSIEGKLYHDKLYGESYTALNSLKDTLLKHNISDVHSLKNRSGWSMKKVDGAVPKKLCDGTPYMDSLSSNKILGLDGKYYFHAGI